MSFNPSVSGRMLIVSSAHCRRYRLVCRSTRFITDVRAMNGKQRKSQLQ